MLRYQSRDKPGGESLVLVVVFLCFRQIQLHGGFILFIKLRTSLQWPWLADINSYNVCYNVAIWSGCSLCLRALNTLFGVCSQLAGMKTNKQKAASHCGRLHLLFSAGVFIQSSKPLCYLRQLLWCAWSPSRKFCLVGNVSNMKC